MARTPTIKQYAQTIVAWLPNLALILAPILLLPLVMDFGHHGDHGSPSTTSTTTSTTTITSESKCLYVILVMAIYWSLNPIPLPITSLLPVVLLPILGLSTTDQACSVYLGGNNMLFFGCLTLALAIETSMLHQRIALKVLSMISAQFRWMLLGFMLVTAFFSMWLVSTATVAMMLPIADEIFANVFVSDEDIQKDTIDDPDHDHQDDQDDGDGQNNGPNNNGAHPTAPSTASSTAEDYSHFRDCLETVIQPKHHAHQHHHPHHAHHPDDHQTLQEESMAEESSWYNHPQDKQRILKIFYLCIAYSATIGGVTTLTSNGPNLIMKDILEKHYSNQDPIDYASWLAFSLPSTITILLILWLILSSLYFRKVKISPTRQMLIRQYIRRKYHRLGNITFHECAVLTVFMVMILLYMFYKPQFLTGWSVWFGDHHPTQPGGIVPKPASAAIFCVLLLFLIPRRLSWHQPNLTQDALMDWSTIQHKLAWGVLIIRGGGFALADAATSSGLSAVVGHNLAKMATVVSMPVLIGWVSVVANMVIEFMRTSATASILFPVLIKLAESMQINPLKIIIPSSMACAYAFISPVGTTCNTLIFYHTKMSIKEMIIPGLIAKTVSLIIMWVNIQLFGNLYFNIDDDQPPWLDTTTKHLSKSMDLIYPMGVFDLTNITATTISTLPGP